MWKPFSMLQTKDSFCFQPINSFKLLAITFTSNQMIYFLVSPFNFSVGHSFCFSWTNNTLVVLIVNCKLLPSPNRPFQNLEDVLWESSLTSILRWNFKTNMDKTICSSDDGQIMLVLSRLINKFLSFFIFSKTMDTK